MILGFVTDLFECFYVITIVRNPYCFCCDSAIMPGEGGGLRQGERERQGYFSIKTASMLGSCFA